MKKVHGVTLIELIIGVAIVAILAAVAVPAYQDQMKSSRRADGQAALMGLAQAMERSFTEFGTYARADGDVSNESDGDNATPTIYPSQSPIDGSNKYYNLRIYSANSSSYEVRAIPISGAAQDGDGTIRLRSTGEKGWDANNDGDFSDSGENCWAKNC